MRICHFLSSKSFAGIEQYVDEISQQQSKDNEVIIICGRKILSKFNKKNVSLLSFSSLGRNSPIGQIRLAFLLRQINPDVISTWSKILKEIKNSKLILKTSSRKLANKRLQ